MNPKVSIIIPNYNHKLFLQERLDSVFNQTFQDFEVILLDDASTDGSAELLKNYQNHPKVSHLIINTINSGSPFKQWQKGIALAKGDYVWIAESDDTNSFYFLEKCLSGIKGSSTIGMITTSLSIFDQHNAEIFTPLKNGIHNGLKLIPHKMLKGNNVRNASGVVFLRESVDIKILNKITEYRICGDWWIWLHVLKNYELYFIDKPLTNYRKHPAATTVNLNDNPLFYIEIEKLLKEVIKWKAFNSSVLDKSLVFWIEKINSSSIEDFQKSILIKKYRKLFSNKRKLNLLKVKLYKFISK